MIRINAIVIAIAMATSVLSACSQSPYCAAIEKSQTSLNSFGSERNDNSFVDYAKTMRAIAKVAPTSSESDWSKLATVTQNVLTVHKQVGIGLEDMSDKAKRDKLSATDIEKLRQAYAEFNNTSTERRAVVTDANETCDIALK